MPRFVTVTKHPYCLDLQKLEGIPDALGRCADVFPGMDAARFRYGNETPLLPKRFIRFRGIKMPCGGGMHH